MARWITIKADAVPFDYRWPDRSALTAFAIPGEQMVKDEVADWAVKKGFASEGKAEGSIARSTKGGGARRRKGAKVAPDAPPADHRTDDRLDGADHDLHGAAGAGGAVDPPAGER